MLCICHLDANIPDAYSYNKQMPTNKGQVHHPTKLRANKGKTASQKLNADTRGRRNKVHWLGAAYFL
jgi:hypothetical protein